MISDSRASFLRCCCATSSFLLSISSTMMARFCMSSLSSSSRPFSSCRHVRRCETNWAGECGPVAGPAPSRLLPFSAWWVCVSEPVASAPPGTFCSASLYRRCASWPWPDQRCDSTELLLLHILLSASRLVSPFCWVASVRAHTHKHLNTKGQFVNFENTYCTSKKNKKQPKTN